ncbi:hypothetical protein BC830DRAFT_601996 [Chytriomyces sp. MP71]|nr:hypothetical protein BC830DRAFT_653979 [Chytriomyces sp. MP71]KAI8612083.1 hypothetical protein BC830DRAFT_601996 [Chytriomyces sp. MP71]
MSRMDDVKDIQPYLKNLVATRQIKPTANTYFVIYYGPDVTITQNGAVSCDSICSYHNSFDISGTPNSNGQKLLFYGVIPYQGGQCDGICGPSDSIFENTCSVSSHEYAGLGSFEAW